MNIYAVVFIMWWKSNKYLTEHDQKMQKNVSISVSITKANWIKNILFCYINFMTPRGPNLFLKVKDTLLVGQIQGKISS